jgi:hypothetical protein
MNAVRFATNAGIAASPLGGTMNRISAFRFVLASFVVLCSIFAVQAFAQPTAADVNFTGLITCSHCVDLAQHKGFTRWSWAMYKVSQGDNIVFLTSGKTYKLQGDKQQLSKYVEDKATVTGHLDADTIEVVSITRPKKEK